MGCIAAIVLALLLSLLIAVMTFNPTVIGNETYYCLLPLVLIAILALVMQQRRR